MSINITVTGRLTKDPELRQTRSGKLVTSFGLAHNFHARVGAAASMAVQDGVPRIPAVISSGTQIPVR